MVVICPFSVLLLGVYHFGIRMHTKELYLYLFDENIFAKSLSSPRSCTSS
uniref:Uncharacterized protein n=1 Tax=Rhizophora mucronata TaxID=61149 RepID=A0A2P2NDK4_RHIMU